MQALTHIALAAAATVALLPVTALAVTPTAFAERSQVIATGENVYLYSLSTKDADGKIRCLDVTMSLAIGSNGQPADTAAVTSAACPKVKVGEFVPGRYRDASGNMTCDLVASPFAGRTELILFCTDSSDGRNYTYTWYTGRIAGSPIEPELTAAGLNTLPGNEQYAWGRITRTDFSSGCYRFGNLFGARQVGNRLNLSIYGDDTVLDCTFEYQKTTP
jgi:hypothetical protein